LRQEDQNELIKAFREQILLERELERAKVDLIDACTDFNLYNAFKIIDKDTRGYVTTYDLLDAWQSPHVLDLGSLTKDDAELFFARYDRDSDRRLKFSEFCSAFTPLDEKRKREVERRGQTSQEMSQKTFLMFRNLWVTHIKIEQQAEYVRSRLSKRATFNVFDAFKAVDANNDGKITKRELKAAIEEGGFQVGEDEVNELMERYDKNGDGVISFAEFDSEI